MRGSPLAALALCLPLSACSGPEGRIPPAYRAVAVPEERLHSLQARERGRALYFDHCMLCHGVNADGQGARREGLSTQPRDFTSTSWRKEATPRTSYYAIREGIPGTAMPSWKSLDESEIWDLVAFVLSVREAGPPPQ